MGNEDDGLEAAPGWLQAMRAAARQRPRTRFVKVQWSHIQDLLRERDALWAAASEETRILLTLARKEYTCKRPPGANYRTVQEGADDAEP